MIERLDQAGELFIKAREKLELRPYRDIAGHWTIGWGHIDGITEKTEPITLAQAERFFRADCESREEAVVSNVKHAITQNEFNALVSFTFNEGIEALRTSTLIRKLNQGDRQGAAKEFERWVYYRDAQSKQKVFSLGLFNRRKEEKALFLKDFLLQRANHNT